MGGKELILNKVLLFLASGIFHPESNIDQHDASQVQTPYLSCVSVWWKCFLRQLSDALVDALIVSAVPSSP